MDETVTVEWNGRHLRTVELHKRQHADDYGQPRDVSADDLAECGTCLRVWCYTCEPGPAARCPFEYEHEEEEPEEDRPTVLEEAERLLSYWEIHGNSPEVVTKWAMEDFLPFLRLVVNQ